MLWSLKNEAVKGGYPGSLRLVRCGLIAVLLAFFVLSVLTIYSATYVDYGTKFFHMQICWIILSIIFGGIISFIPLEYLYRNAHWFLIAICLPLIYLTVAACMWHINSKLLSFFPFTREINGAIRWLVLGPISIQPSEFAKFFILLFLASYYGAISRTKSKEFVVGMIIPGVAVGIVLALIFFGKDLSTTFITGVMTGSIMLIAGVRFRFLLLIVISGLLLVYVAITGSSNRMNRIKAVQNPEQYRFGESYQLYRSQLCLGSGGMTGTGYSMGYMKTYLPEQHTDFIVAVIGEEFGLLGTYSVIGLYLTLLLCLIGLSLQCRDRRDMLLCLGTGILIVVQAFVNIGVVSGCLPPTGVTAPFLSYGGSSMLSMMMGLGLCFNVANRNSECIHKEMQQFKFAPKSMI